MVRFATPSSALCSSLPQIANQFYVLFSSPQLNPSAMYGAGTNQMSQESLYAPGTPSRSKSRPSQPPPAPPSSGSGGGTPNASNANTPTRSRSLSTGRDNLPPPPPIPEGLQSPPHGLSNGGTSVAAKLLLNRSGSRAGSPQLGMTGGPQQQQQHQQQQQQQQPRICHFVIFSTFICCVRIKGVRITLGIVLTTRDFNL